MQGPIFKHYMKYVLQLYAIIYVSVLLRVCDCLV